MSARKPDSQRLRRNQPEIPWTDIDAGPRKGRAPKPPAWSSFGPAAKLWWAWAWKLTVAKAWGDEEFSVAARRAEFEDRWQGGDTKVLTEMRHCETALGMTPLARNQLRWRIVDSGVVVEENGEAVADELAERRRSAS